jgi:hypothetical protein
LQGKETFTMKIDAPLASRLAKSRDSDEINVIITLENHEAYDAVVRKTGIKTVIPYESIPSVAATVSAAKVRELAALPQVTQVELDSEAQALPRTPGK